MVGKILKKAALSFLTASIAFSLLNCSNEKSESTNAGNETDSQLQLKASHKTAESIKWYSFEDGIKQARLEKKYIFVDFYTDWCTYCKKLEAETYTNEKVYNYLNKKFIPIKVNAESKTKISFGGQKLTEQELATQFQVVSYPTLYFLASEKEVIGQIPSFIDANELFTIASYVATDAYKNKTLDQYKSARKI
jgi:thioredoxin-related protein